MSPEFSLFLFCFAVWAVGKIYFAVRPEQYESLRAWVIRWYE